MQEIFKWDYCFEKSKPESEAKWFLSIGCSGGLRAACQEGAATGEAEEEGSIYAFNLSFPTSSLKPLENHLDFTV